MAVTAVLAVVALVICLLAAELLDAHWLYIPGIAFFLIAIAMGEFVTWSLRGAVIMIGALGVVLGLGILSEAVSG